MKDLVVILCCSFLLGACVTPILSQEMMPDQNIYSSLGNKNLKNNVTVGSVSLSQEMPTSGVVITAEEFKKTLQSSFANAGWQTLQKGTYELTANFIKQDMPYSLYNTTVFSTVDYTLVNTATHKTVYSERVNLPCVITAEEEFDALIRQMETQACSVSVNVTHLLRTINSKF